MAGRLFQRGSARRSTSVSPITNPLICPVGVDDRRVRLLTFNIQVGIRTRRYHQYLTKGWKHLLPHEARETNLNRIAEVCSDFDVVALQEIDAGSLRSGFVDQVEYLATRAGFPYWYTQRNRDLGPLAQHGNGLLTRLPPRELQDHKLPGVIPGRGAIVARLPFGDPSRQSSGDPADDLLVILLHLSLGSKSRERQLSYVRELMQGHRHVIVMGDMNSHLTKLLFHSPLADADLRPADEVQPTYPSWRPAVAIDHVLVSSTLAISDYEVLPHHLSDHLPTAVTVEQLADAGDTPTNRPQ